MRQAKANAPRSIHDAIPQVWILETFGHQARLRCFGPIDHLPREHLSGVNRRLAHFPNFQGFEYLEGLPRTRLLALPLAYYNCMRSLSPFRQLLTRDAVVFICHACRDSRFHFPLLGIAMS